MTYLSQMRQLIQGSFEPMACECLICSDGSLTVRVYDLASGRVDLVVTGIAIDTLKTHEDVRRLIEELRDELATVSTGSDFGQSSQA